MMYKRKIAKLQTPKLASVKSSALSAVLCVVMCSTMFVGCYHRACDGGMLPPKDVSQQELEAQVEKKINLNLEEYNAKTKIVQTIYDDFDNNGESEAFILTRENFNKKQSRFKLWYATKGEATKLRQSFAYNGSYIKLISGSNYKHVLVGLEQGTFNKTMIYGLVNGEPQLLFKHNTLGAKIVNDQVFISIKDYYVYDNSIKNWLCSDVVEYGVHFDETLNQYVNYDAKKIDEQQFSEYGHSEDVITKIETWVETEHRKGFYKATQKKFEFLLREDSTIDVNCTVTCKDKNKYNYYSVVSISGESELNLDFEVKPGNKRTSSNYYLHDKYINKLKTLNCVSKYAFMDIDKDGTEELLVKGYVNAVVTLKQGKLKWLCGGKHTTMRIYPDEGIVYVYQGHMSMYVEQYVKISGGKSKVVAQKTWEIGFDETGEDEDFYFYNHKYKINGSKVSEQEYNAFKASMKSRKVLKNKDIDWIKYGLGEALVIR